MIAVKQIPIPHRNIGIVCAFVVWLIAVRGRGLFGVRH